MDREASTLGIRASNETRAMVRRTLAALAACLGALAMLAGDPTPPQVPRASAVTVDVAAVAQEIAKEKDHVTPLELARWIRDRKEGLRVIDIRSSEERDERLIPTAEAVELAALPSTAFRVTDTVVLYSAEGVHAGQAWVLLRALGVREVFFLRGGWAAWHEEVMHPTLEDGAPAEAQSAFAPAAELSRYFGGTPRIAPRPARGTDERTPSLTNTSHAPTPPKDAPPAPPPRRRGC